MWLAFFGTVALIRVSSNVRITKCTWEVNRTNSFNESEVGVTGSQWGRLVLTVYKGNLAAIKSYEKFGFIRVASQLKEIVMHFKL